MVYVRIDSDHENRARRVIGLVQNAAARLAPDARVEVTHEQERSSRAQTAWGAAIIVDGIFIEHGLNGELPLEVPSWLIETALVRAQSPRSILFLCEANSTRSQMAEGIAKHILGGRIRVRSAGTQPGGVNPLAVRVMAEIDIDISRHYSKSVRIVRPNSVDAVFMLCAGAQCPTSLAGVRRVHWELPDPNASDADDPDMKVKSFRQVRDELVRRIDYVKAGLV